MGKVGGFFLGRCPALAVRFFTPSMASKPDIKTHAVPLSHQNNKTNMINIFI